METVFKLFQDCEENKKLVYVSMSDIRKCLPYIQLKRLLTK